MKISDFKQLVGGAPNAVVLLEGRRGIAEAEALAAQDFGEFLARRFPTLRFRSGNAEGADQAFADGVAGVDAQRAGASKAKVSPPSFRLSAICPSWLCGFVRECFVFAGIRYIRGRVSFTAETAAPT